MPTRAMSFIGLLTHLLNKQARLIDATGADLLREGGGSELSCSTSDVLPALLRYIPPIKGSECTCII